MYARNAELIELPQARAGYGGLAGFRGLRGSVIHRCRGDRLMSKNPVYHRASFEVRANRADDAGAILIAHGALGCAVERTRPHGRARTVTLDAYFARRPSANSMRRLAALLANAALIEKPVQVEPRRIVDPGWVTQWKNRFKPFAIGQRLQIVPPWDRKTESDRLQIVIEPAQAFGTGHHATTAGALCAIEEIASMRKVRRALDVGTGSGILAIAIAGLTDANVTAIDIDEVALDNARLNAKYSRVAARIGFSSRPLDQVTGKFDLIVANILSKVLIALAADLKRRFAARGTLVLSGILAREADAVAAHYGEFRLVAKRIDHAWATMVFER